MFLNPGRGEQYRIYIFTVYWHAANTGGTLSVEGNEGNED